MTTTVDPHAGDLVPIGEAARQFGLATSALRFYEERGLLQPASRAGGRRWYGHEQLRRIAFIRAAQDLGMRLEHVAALLNPAQGTDWRATVAEHLTALQQQLAWIQSATTVLERVLDCPADHGPAQCPYLTAALDAWIAGGLWRGDSQLDRQEGVMRMFAQAKAYKAQLVADGELPGDHQHPVPGVLPGAAAPDGDLA